MLALFIYCICTQYLVGAPFALITASIWRDMEVISLWHCWGGMEAQVSLTVAFSSSTLLGLVSLIFLLTIVIFLHSPGKMLLTLSLVQKWLGSPFPEDVWAWWLLMHWLQLQSTPCEALTSVWISFAWLYSQACGHPCCLCTFSYPNSSFQSTLHLICFDTALCKQPHLSVMTLCDLPSLCRASMFVFWIIAKSAVFPIIVVSKNRRYPEFILNGWSFIDTQM